MKTARGRDPWPKAEQYGATSISLSLPHSSTSIASCISNTEAKLLLLPLCLVLLLAVLGHGEMPPSPMNLL